MSSPDTTPTDSENAAVQPEENEGQEILETGTEETGAENQGAEETSAEPQAAEATVPEEAAAEENPAEEEFALPQSPARPAQAAVSAAKSDTMKLDCSRREFADAVAMAQQATRAGSPQNIFQNLKLEAAGGSLKILGCDGEMWVEREIPAMIHGEGAACVQAKLLSDIVSKLPDGDLQLRMLEGGGMMLQQGASEYRMLTLDAEDFPEPPDYGGEGELTMPMGDLRAAIESVSYAVSQDMHRQILTGVLFSYDGTTLTLVATDTHRLAVRKLHQPGLGSSITAVVPERALKAIRSLPLGEDDKITIRFGVGRLGVDAGAAKVVSQLLQGAYPNWERVVPTEWTRKWTVEGDEMLDRVGRAMVVARDAANRVRFKGDGDQITILARSEEKGEAKEELAMVAQSGDIEIAFNGQYVLDAVRAIPGPGVLVEMTEASRPAVFRPTEDEGYFCVIMPMALA
jgi:DNA polymerase III subunit beta